MPLDPKMIVQEIDAVIAECAPAVTAMGNDRDAIWAPETHKTANVLLSAIRRLAPPGSSYLSEIDRAVEHAGSSNTELLAVKTLGALRALGADLAAGRLRSFEELVHASLFTDYVTQARYFHGEGWLMPAAVIVGATLEEHLRALATKNGIDVAPVDPRTSNPRPLMASALNDELYKLKPPVYDKAQRAVVQAWIAIRNDAAHGKPEFLNRTPADIERLIDGVQEFVAKYPA